MYLQTDWTRELVLATTLLITLRYLLGRIFLVNCIATEGLREMRIKGSVAFGFVQSSPNFQKEDVAKRPISMKTNLKIIPECTIDESIKGAASLRRYGITFDGNIDIIVQNYTSFVPCVFFTKIVRFWNLNLLSYLEISKNR